MDQAPTKPKGWVLPLCFALIIGAAFVELLFRVVIFPDWRDVSQANFERHPIYGTFQKPNMVIRRFNPPNYDVINRTNSRGFRDRDEGFDDDLAGIWAAGASNSYGAFMEDDEIFSARLQQRGYKVANLSSEGHRLGAQIRVVRHLVSQGYRPRAVLFEMTLNNALGEYGQDIADLMKPLKIQTDAPSARQDGTASALLKRQVTRLKKAARISWLAIKGRLINNSAFYTWLKVGINGIPALRDWTLKVGLRADVTLVDPTPPGLLRDVPETPNDVLIQSAVDLSVAVKDWVGQTLNVPFAIILVPGPHHLNPKDFSRYMRHLGLDENEMDATRPFRLLKQGLIANGVPVLDTAPALLASDEFLRFPDDGHMNATAHAIVAGEVAKFLAHELGLEPDL